MASEPPIGGPLDPSAGSQTSTVALLCVLIIMAGTVVTLMVLLGFGPLPAH